MSYAKTLYRDLLKVVEEMPTKFFCNVHRYKGHNIAIFDYSLTIPNDFGFGVAREARGSCFLLDDNEEVIDILALPFEKFFNLHEFQYENSHDLHAMTKNVYGVDVSNEHDLISFLRNNATVMDKRDGSIITFFDLLGNVDAKSNSSLTSEYKNEAMDLLYTNSDLYNKVDYYTKQKCSVMVEYTSDNPYRQIVIPYNKKELRVTAVRRHEDGSYVPMKELKEHFGDYMVDTIDDVVDPTEYEQEGIEGYILYIEELGFRVKLKTQWYLDRHRLAAHIVTPSNVWVMYLNGEADDVYSIIPEPNKGTYTHFITKCDELFTKILTTGNEIYEKHKHLDRAEFFKEVQEKNPEVWKRVAIGMASSLYMGKNYDTVVESIKEDLKSRKKISRLGITEWTYN